MKGFEMPFEGFVKGLRPYENMPKNSQTLVECFNLAPAEAGLEMHEEIVDIASTREWGGEGVYTPTEILRDITIRVLDYVDVTELAGVTVYIDSVDKGVTDASGELAIASVSVGGHDLKMTKTGYYDSDSDTLFNDFIFVI